MENEYEAAKVAVDYIRSKQGRSKTDLVARMRDRVVDLSKASSYQILGVLYKEKILKEQKIGAVKAQFLGDGFTGDYERKLKDLFPDP